MLVETVLQQKRTEVATVTPEASLAEAAALLSANHAELVVVCDARQKVVGVVTDSDIMRCVAGCDGQDCGCVRTIVDVMTRKVVTCTPDSELHEVWATMNARHLRRFPIVDADGKLLAVINLRDVFRFLSEEKQMEAREFLRFLTPPPTRGEPMTEVLETLHQEHFRIGAVLTCLRHLSAGLSDAGREAEPGLLSTILDYMEAFPDTTHHPKEEAFLFEALRRRKPDEADLLDGMIDEHAFGATLLAKLRSALQEFHNDPSSLEQFQRAVNTYVEFEHAHMRREENVLMPLAARYLRPKDWNRINEAFSWDVDPLFGKARRATYEKLFKYILEHDPDSRFAERAGS